MSWKRVVMVAGLSALSFAVLSRIPSIRAEIVADLGRS